MAQLEKEVVITFYCCFYCLFNECKIQFHLLHSFILIAQYGKKKRKVNSLLRVIYRNTNLVWQKRTIYIVFKQWCAIFQGSTRFSSERFKDKCTLHYTCANISELWQPCSTDHVLSSFFVTICVVTRPTSTFSRTSLSVDLAHAPEEWVLNTNYLWAQSQLNKLLPE